MGVNWTRDQEEVIRLRDCNILVSAAAGSGKTAVLVERIMKLITDGEHPWDIDELLIVTFTKAAASEMKDRLRKALDQALEKNPDNVHLKRQTTLIHQAMITTIDGFCAQVLREHFYLLDLEPGFRIVEEGENQLLKEDAVNQVLSDWYERKESRFVEFVENYCTKKTDDELASLIIRLYEFAMSNPWPMKWLDKCLAGGFDKEILEKSGGMVQQMLKDAAYRMELCLEAANEPDGPESYVPVLEDECEKLYALSELKDYEKLYKGIGELNFARLPSKKNPNCAEEKKKWVQDGRNKVKDRIKKIKASYFFDTPEKIVEEMKAVRPMVEVLVELTKDFITVFQEMKREKNLLDFGDLEHLCLDILVDEETGKATKTAEEYQQKFKTIMVDEYQDSNMVQELLLTAVSGMEQGRFNLFMVGDVKQSIYRFRQARPELFLEKYKKYSENKGVKRRIDLHQNFRSRAEIVETVNTVFSSIMGEDVGGIGYDESARLNLGASYPIDEEQKKFDKTEIVLADESNWDESNDAGSKKDMEIEAVIHIVKEQLKGKVADKQGNFRPVEYGDIVVLLRSPGSWGDDLLKAMLDAGIPTKAVSRTGYFAAEEVQTVLNLLQLVDNGRQDIPLAAVLTSPICGLKDTQLAKIRAYDVRKPFHLCAAEYAKEGEDAKIVEALREFYALLQELREIARYRTVHELILEIFRKTGYDRFAAAMPAGKTRIENLDMLVEKAVNYEKTSYHGVFHFLRYINQLKKYEIDYGVGKQEEGADTVRIMSIHKSKGLEFPIVILAGCGRMMNKRELSEKLVMHPELGIAMDYLDGKRRIRKNNLAKEVLAEELRRENMGEEIRVLYVALTRAKEKLILVGAVAKAEEKLESYANMLYHGGGMLHEDKIGATNYFSLLLPPLQAKGLADIRLYTGKNAEEKAEEISGQVDKVLLLEERMEQIPDEQLGELDDLFAWKYPFHQSREMKNKMSVSEIKHRFMELAFGEDAAKPEFLEAEQEPVVPEFLEQHKEENPGALRGTATHRFLECLDFTSDICTLDEQDMKDRKEELAKQGMMEEAALALVGTAPILSFLHSGLAKRMHEAAKSGRLYKEHPFVMGVTPRQAGLETDSEEMILVQGIIDAFFEEDGEIVLVDYKTDRVAGEEELVKRYAKQMELYSMALEMALHKRVKEQIIFSTSLRKEIVVTD